MKIDTQSNNYTFLYSAVLVVVFAAVLSVAALKLQPLQQKNRDLEKKQNILASVHIVCKTDSVEILWKKYMRNAFLIDSAGNISEGTAFNLNMKEELAKKPSERKLAVFECVLSDSSHVYALPVRGTGLWGPIWGYVSLKDDFKTIYGAFFDHEGETPGLGAEIALPVFQQQFNGKKIFNENGDFTSVKILKPGQSEGNIHAVDGISGGTITSKGLDAMLHHCLAMYQPFFLHRKNK